MGDTGSAPLACGTLIVRRTDDDGGRACSPRITDAGMRMVVNDRLSGLPETPVAPLLGESDLAVTVLVLLLFKSSFIASSDVFNNALSDKRESDIFFYFYFFFFALSLARSLFF